MKFEVIALPQFLRESKRLTKKYRSLKTELAVLFDELAQNPSIGAPLGNEIYKIRLAIASKGKGKSGGARIITYLRIDEKTVLLLTIYNKGEKDNISDKENREIIKHYLIGH